MDGQSAYNIVRFLRKLANAGQAILVTVHQPNALLFESFDRLLLLKKGGRTVYFGDIGIDSKVIRRYFESQGADCPADANPAEFMLEAIGAGSRRMIGKEDWADRWLDSREAAQVRIEIEGLKADALQHESDVDTTVQTEYATGFRAQMGIVGRRTHLALWRNPNYGFTRRTFLKPPSSLPRHSVYFVRTVLIPPCSVQPHHDRTRRLSHLPPTRIFPR